MHGHLVLPMILFSKLAITKVVKATTNMLLSRTSHRSGGKGLTILNRDLVRGKGSKLKNLCKRTSIVILTSSPPVS